MSKFSNHGLQTNPFWFRSVAGLQAESEQTTEAPHSTTQGLPSQPQQPDQPSQPQQPDQPSQPEQPSQPQQPEQPEQPSTPAPPSTPGIPSTPSQPSTPGVPSQGQQNQTQVSPPSQPQQPNANNATSQQPQQPQQPNVQQPQQPNQSNATQPQVPSQPSQPGTNGTGIQGVDFGGAAIRSLQDMLAQFGSMTRTLAEISQQFNQLVQSSSRLVTGGRRKRQANPLEMITGMLTSLTRQATDISSQLSGLLGTFGRVTGDNQGQGSNGRGPAGDGNNGGGSPLEALTSIPASLLGSLARVGGAGR